MTAFGGLNHFQGHLKHIIIQGHIYKKIHLHIICQVICRKYHIIWYLVEL